ncbi:MAG TPA: 3-oxoacyl-[acyl-carrier-protein] synthase III C-terminal domain-containing protein, partial [Smithellaceae bacterium]|nr:3-oxoacyl-[acyl-carrier-protein] synthase III C-terminal domain-containing protein [Smithellaceae bacterium]HPM70614.1 3-oxoacyl-[acyl-carrier-protein] synthase III C-terminal domain-containing protein [Smithellaceae bacterium]HPW23612.1 3-oxoacyl-[acyl-carrier-protein] synthase III C-terminal domain-containing protein [Smithellaceae bacterium]
KTPEGKVIGWRELDSLQEAVNKNYLALKQDTEILGDHVVRLTVNEALTRTMQRRKIKPEEIDWYLPHYSSEFFRDKIHDAMVEVNFKIPYERWFTNLTYKGNTGAASIYVMLEEIFHADKLKEGQKILCYVPESGRFSVAYILFTVI